ncbi:MAG: radical SAM protein [Desulfobacterales bacterium]|jgi:MoaA/NifB/PqqE/SkfB family radical SAM enzyme
MFFERLIPNNYPQLDWIQVEISSYCNASCFYCPHSTYRVNWQNRYLSMESFHNLIPAFRKTALVYLQGWGEPFTHPRFFEMLKIAKAAGCMVGTTTNGTLLGRETIEKMVSEGLDVIGFSLAGVDEKNDRIRKGTRIKKVLECIEEIHRAKDKFGTDNPQIHIAYMLLRSGLDDLEKLPIFLGNTGAAQIVVSSLSYIVSPEMETESVLVCGKEEYLELKDRLLEVKREADNQGIDVHFHIVPPVQKKFCCSENIPRAVVVGSDGSLSPCVMKQIPVRGDNFYYANGKKNFQQNLSFGNVQTESLKTIWHRKEYRKVINKFRKREAPSFCQSCLKRTIDNLE